MSTPDLPAATTQELEKLVQLYYDRATAHDSPRACFLIDAMSDLAKAAYRQGAREQPENCEIRVQHARKQGAADGFQEGWHAVLTRIREGDSLTELTALVPPTLTEQSTRAKAEGARDTRAQWQPIETAPRDGRFVLLCEPKWQAGAVVGKWFDFEGVIHGETGFWEAHATQVYPTGWMPLPDLAAALRASEIENADKAKR